MQVILVLAYFRYSQELKVESIACHFGIVVEEKIYGSENLRNMGHFEHLRV
jgi:hypothetical protein